MADLRMSDNRHMAITKFQRFAGLPPTGVMDAATWDMMNMPRCGVPDMGVGSDGRDRRRRRRYVIQGEVDITVGPYTMFW